MGSARPSDPELDPDAIRFALERRAEDDAHLRREYERERAPSQAGRYRERYATDPEFREKERVRSRTKARRDHHRRGTAERLYRSAALSAKKKSLPFALTVGLIRQMWPEDGRCPVLGYRMLLDGEREVLPTLDRFDPDLGYVPGNVRIISFRANRLKSDSHPAELARVLAYAMSRDPGKFVFRDGDHVVEYVKGFEVG